MLYPLKFKPLLKERIWGGDSLRSRLKTVRKSTKKYGESWEVSGFTDDMSVVDNGRLRGNTLGELIEVYMGELVGDSVFNRFGLEFPLLIKYIDAQDLLSIQVHPDNNLAARLHNAYGKTEMWHILECEKDAEIFLGFRPGVTPDKYQAALSNGTLPDILNHYTLHTGDTFFIPSGTVHTICGGSKLVEIQQTSDITYRIYDWGRVDKHGVGRELHTDLAMQAINFGSTEQFNRTRPVHTGEIVELVDCPFFTTNIIEVKGSFERDLTWLNSFAIYICTKGDGTLHYSDGTVDIHSGDIYLVPAVEQNIRFEGSLTVLETYC